MKNVILVTTNLYYCKKYECGRELEFLPFIKSKILTANAWDVEVYVEEEW